MNDRRDRFRFARRPRRIGESGRLRGLGSLGLRHRFKLGQVPASFRFMLSNVFDDAAWKVLAANTLQMDDRRRITALLCQIAGGTGCLRGVAWVSPRVASGLGWSCHGKVW